MWCDSRTLCLIGPWVERHSLKPPTKLPCLMIWKPSFKTLHHAQAFPSWQELSHFYMRADLKVTVKVSLHSHDRDYCLSSSKIHYTVKTAFGKRTHWGCSLIRLFRLSTPLIVFPCQWTWIHTVLSSHSNQPFAVGCDAWSMSSSALYFSSILYILRFRSLPPHPLSPSGSQMKNWRNIVLTISHNPK